MKYHFYCNFQLYNGCANFIFDKLKKKNTQYLKYQYKWMNM